MVCGESSTMSCRDRTKLKSYMSICKIVEKVIQKYGLPWAFRVMGEHRLEPTNIVPHRS
jgi:hypothetical protein